MNDHTTCHCNTCMPPPERARQVITLEIIFDRYNDTQPTGWDWNAMLDSYTPNNDSEIKIIASGDIEPLT